MRAGSEQAAAERDGRGWCDACVFPLTVLVVPGLLGNAHVHHDVDGVRHVQVEVGGAHLTVLGGDQT